MHKYIARSPWNCYKEGIWRVEGGCSNRNEKDLVELSKCSIAIREHSFPTGCMLCSLANDAWEIILTQTVETVRHAHIASYVHGNEIC